MGEYKGKRATCPLLPHPLRRKCASHMPSLPPPPPSSVPWLRYHMTILETGWERKKERQLEVHLSPNPAVIIPACFIIFDLLILIIKVAVCWTATFRWNIPAPWITRVKSGFLWFPLWAFNRSLLSNYSCKKRERGVLFLKKKSQQPRILAGKW